MTDTNQKLREALQSISHIDDSTNHAVDASAALDRIGQIARQALALPTAAQVGDINVAESFTSAAPVGEREAFEHTMMDKFGWERKDFKTDEFGYFDGHTVTAWMTWQARAALSAGDAADAQRYRWLRDEAWAGYNQGKGFPHVFTIDGAGNRRTMLAEDALDASIDAAMRKGQL